MVPKSRDHHAGGHGLVAKLQRRPVLLALAALFVLGYALNVTQFGKSSSLRSFDRAVASEHHQDAAIDDGLDDATRTRCYEERDFGMIEKLRESRRTLCDDDTGVDPALGPLSTYTYYYTPGSDIRGTVVRNLWVDMRGAEVYRPIKDLSQDGGGHDPRLKYPSVGVHCTCRRDQNQDTATIPHVWAFMFGEHPDTEKKQPWRFCHAFKSKDEQDALASGVTPRPWNKTLMAQHKKQHAKDGVALVTPHPSGWPYQVHHVKTNAIIMGRRDDHNPFFMIAATMHSWIMMQVLEWSPETTQLVYFDDAIPAETDELQRLMLAPVQPVVHGRDIFGSVLRFDKALVAPFEFWGPMMRHLGSEEPCRRNKMIADFRDQVMAKYKVSHAKKDPRSCTVTIISRRPYKGRNVQRKWLNEDAIVDRMIDDYVRDPLFYKYGTCTIQSIDFVDLPLDQQMRVIVESDVIIGMHGAGMVNLMWVSPGTVVVEIFPKNRHRWGYKNLCFFLGCEWHQFRDGKDTGRGKGDNSSDKLISYADWFPFFDPIMRKAVRALEARVAQMSDLWR